MIEHCYNISMFSPTCLTLLLFLFICTADTATVNIAVDQLTVTEDTVRAGGHKMTFTLTGATWNTMTNSLKDSLIKAFVSDAPMYEPMHSTYYPNGWRERRGAVLNTNSIALSDSTTVVVTFQGDIYFNIALRENVNITIPSALTSSTVTNKVVLHVNPSSGVVTMPSYEITEDSLRAGGTVFTIALSSQETWSDVRQIINVTTGTSSATSLWNFVRTRGQAMPPQAVTHNGQNLVISLTAAPSYDCSTNEVVTIDVPSSAVRSGLKPSGTITFTIKATQGYFRLPNPTILREQDLVHERTYAPSITLTLEYGETWKDSLDKAAFVGQWIGNGVDTHGFNNRRSSIMPSSGVTVLDQHRIKITFTSDLTFDITVTETVTFTGLGTMVNSGMAPVQKTGSQYAGSFVISPGAGIIRWSTTPTFAESDILSGSKSITFTLERGETWAAGKETDILAGFVATTSQTNGWNNRKATMLPLSTSPKAITLGGSNRDLVLSFAVGTSSLYDIDQLETVRFSPTASMMSSSTAPDNTTLLFHVMPTLGTLSMTHATKTSPFSFTEDEVRRGMGTITLTWSQGETWSGHSFTALNISSQSNQYNGWYSRSLQRGHLLNSNQMSFTNGMRTMLLDVCSDAEYDIATPDTLHFYFPKESISSRMVPSEYLFTITVTPTTGRISLVCCGTYGESEINRGGASLTLSFAPGETWVDSQLSSILSHFTSNRADETNGWQQRSSRIMQLSHMSLSNHSRVLTIRFVRDPHYDLLKYVDETISLNLKIPPFPAQAIHSGKEPSPNLIQFQILKQPGMLNTTRDETSTSAIAVVTEKQINQGGVRVHLYMSAWESWVPTQKSAIISGLTSDQSETTGFNALRSTILPDASTVYIPASRATSNIAYLTTRASNKYDIATEEKVSVALAPAVVHGAVAPTTAYFRITVSRGEITMNPSETSEDVLRTAGLMVTFTLSAWETWHAAQPATTIRDGITSSLSPLHPSYFIMNRNAFLRPQNITVFGGRRLVIGFSAVPTYDVPLHGEVLTFNFPTSSTRSALVPVLASTGAAPTLTVKFHRGDLYLDSNSFLVTEKAMRTTTTTITLHVRGETFVLRDECRLYLVGNHSNVTALDRTLPSGMYQTKTRVINPTVADVVTVNAAGTEMYIKLQPVSFFDERKEETVLITPSRACYASRMLAKNPSVAVSFRIHPGTFSVTPTTFTETEIRTGTARLTLTLSDSPEGWSNNAWGIVNRMDSDKTALEQPFGFTARKSHMLNPAVPRCFTYTSPTACVRFNNILYITLSDANYDISKPETITIDINKDGTGVCPCLNGTYIPVSPRHTVTITPIVASVAIAPATFTLREHDLRSRHMSFNLTLSDGETWADTTATRNGIIDGMVSDLMIGYGATHYSFNAIKSRTPNALLSAASFHLLTKWTYLIAFNTTPVYETSFDEKVTMTIPSYATASGLAPTSKPTFRILNEDGVQISVRPATWITENDVRSGKDVVLYVYRRLRYRPTNATWNPLIRERLASYVVSNRLGAGYENAFTARKSSLVTFDRIAVSGHALTLTLGADVMYDTPADEVITFTLPKWSTSVVTAPPTFTLTIKATSGAISLSTFPSTVTEEDVRAGRVYLNLTLAEGETWKPSALSSLSAAMSANKNEPTGFNVLRPTIVSTTQFTIRHRTLEVKLRVAATYDISADETVTISPPGNMFASGLAPTPASLTFTITKKRGYVALSPYPLSLTEANVRTGGHQFTLTLMTGEKWKANFADMIQGFTAVTGTQATNQGFSNRRSALLPTFAFSISSDGYRLLCTLQADAVYDTRTMESIKISVPATMVSSGIVPYTVHRLEWNITATPATVSVMGNGFLTEYDVRKGAPAISFAISEDAWVSDSANVVGALTSQQNEATGFNSLKSSLLATSGVSILGTNTILRFTMTQMASYDITADETVSFPVPPTATSSGKAPSNSPLTFTIRRAYLSMNTTVIHESEIRAGTAKLEIRLIYDSWVSGTESTGLAALTAPADALGAGFAYWKSLITTSTSSYFSGSSFIIRLNAAPGYDACQGAETVTFTFPDSMFASGKTTAQTMSFKITSTPSYVKMVSSGDTGPYAPADRDVVVVREEMLRRGGFTLNLTTPLGTWAATAETIRLAMRGSSNGTYSFNARRGVLLPVGSVRRMPTKMVVEFHADPYYNVAGNETISLYLPRAYYQCEMYPSIKRIVVLGRPSAVQELTLHQGASARQPHIGRRNLYIDSNITVVVRGHELTPRVDRMIVISNVSNCNDPTVRVYNSTKKGDIMFTQSSRFVSVVWWTFNVRYAGTFKVCYSVNRTAFVAKGSTVTVVPRLVSMKPIKAAIPVGVATTFTFRGQGLSTRSSNGDAVKLIAVSERQDCATEHSEYYTKDLPGDSEVAREVSVAHTFRMSGVYAWCYRLRSGSWQQFESFNITSVVTAHNVRVVMPWTPFQITVSGMGLDTRKGRPTTDFIGLVKAHSERAGNCSAGNFLRFTMDPQPSSNRGELNASMAVGAPGLDPGFYTVCVRRTGMSWQALHNNIRVRSVALSFAPTRFVPGGRVTTFNVTGNGILYPRTGQLYIKVVLDRQGCDAVAPYRGPISPHYKMPTQVSYDVFLGVTGRYMLCWTTLERAMGWLPLPPTIDVRPTVDDYAPRDVRAARSSQIVVRGWALDPETTVVFVVRWGQACVAGGDIIFRSRVSTTVGGLSSVQRATLTTTAAFSRVSPGQFQVCVNSTTLGLTFAMPSPLRVHAHVDKSPFYFGTPHRVEQYSNDEAATTLTVSGYGLDGRDTVRVLRTSATSRTTCAATAAAPLKYQEMHARPSGTLARVWNATEGLTRVNFTLDTREAGDYIVCYRPHLATAFSDIGNVTIYPFVPAMKLFSFTTNTAGDEITLHFHGKGLDTRPNADTVRLVVSHVVPKYTPRPVTSAPTVSPTTSPPTTTAPPTPPPTTPPPMTPTPFPSPTLPPVTVSPGPTAPPTPPTPIPTLDPNRDCNGAYPIRASFNDLSGVTAATNDVPRATHAYAVWRDAFYDYPVTNITVCYRFAGRSSYVRVGHIDLPFANQVPIFDLFSTYLETREVVASTTLTTKLSADIRVGQPSWEFWQSLRAVVWTNDTSIVTAATFLPRAKELTYTIAGNVYGFARINLTLSDDGGTLFRGTDTAYQSLVLRVFPRNTAPTFLLKNNTMSVLQTDNTLHHMRGFITNILGGTVLDHETNQNVTFTVQLTSASQHKAYFSLLPEVYFSTSSGRRVAHLRYRLNPQTALPTTVSFTVTAHDNGGRANSGVDVSAPQPFKISILFVNRAPSYRWVGEVHTHRYADLRYSARHLVDIAPGLNEAAQVLTVQMELYRTLENGTLTLVPPLAWAQYFAEVPQYTGSGTERVLSFMGRPFVPALMMLRTRVVDDGGTALGGQNTSSWASFAIDLWAHYRLLVSPSVGQSYFTNFTFTFDGGEAVNATMRGRLMIQRGKHTALNTDTAMELRATSTRRTFTTKALPTGDVTVFAIINALNGTSLGMPYVQLNVGATPTNVSLSSIVSDIAKLATTDPAAALYQATTVGTVLSSDSELSASEAAALRQGLASSLSTATTTLLAKSATMGKAQLLSTTEALKSVTTLSPKESSSGAKLPEGMVTSVAATQSKVVGAVPESARTKETTNTYLALADTLASNVESDQHPVWTSADDVKLIETAEAVTRRHRLGRVALGVLDAIQATLVLDCQRQLAASKGSTSDSIPYARTNTNYVTESYAANSATAPLQPRTSTIQLAKGVVKVTAPRPTRDTCRGTVVFPQTTMFPTTGDPATTPSAPLVAIRLSELTSLGAGTVTPVTIEVPKPSGPVDSPRLVLFSTATSEWVVGPDAEVVGNTIVGTINMNTHARTSSSFRKLLQAATSTDTTIVVGVVSNSPIELDPCFLCIAIPVAFVCGLLIVIIAHVMDKRNRIFAPHNYADGEGLSSLEFLELIDADQNERWALYAVRYNLWTSLVLDPLPYSNFTRRRRAVALISIAYGVLFGCMWFIKNESIDYEYENRSLSVDTLESMWTGTIAALVASIVGWGISLLFTSSDPAQHYLNLPPQYAASAKEDVSNLTAKLLQSRGRRGRPALQLPVPEVRRARSILAYVVFVLWGIGCFVGIGTMSHNWNTDKKVERYNVTIAFSFLFSVLLEVVHAIAVIASANARDEEPPRSIRAATERGDDEEMDVHVYQPQPNYDDMMYTTAPPPVMLRAGAPVSYAARGPSANTPQQQYHDEYNSYASNNYYGNYNNLAQYQTTLPTLDGRSVTVSQQASPTPPPTARRPAQAPAPAQSRGAHPLLSL
eukprot:PhM_4_TR10499/c0_g2_i1/m.88664